MDSDPSDPLCLFCSSSLEPHHRNRQSATSPQPQWKTPCCSQPICENCLARNPRLLYYNPCLKCLSGVGALQSQRNPPHATLKAVEPNSDDRFVIADDEAGSDDGSDKGREDLRSSSIPYGNSSDPPSKGLSNGTREVLHRISSESSPSAPIFPVDAMEPFIQSPQTSSTLIPPSPATEYYIKPKDTLRGIALALGVDARKLCVLNKLPISTVSTSPQLLHTRVTLKLPPEVKIPSPPPSSAEMRRKEMERVEKRIQLLTKEPDSRVAKTYVALAELNENDPPINGKDKASGDVKSINERAVDAYYDDVAWEEESRRSGGNSRIAGFPYFSASREKGS